MKRTFGQMTKLGGEWIDVHGPADRGIEKGAEPQTAWLDSQMAAASVVSAAKRRRKSGDL